MFTRPLIAFMALPCMVAFVVPAAWLRYSNHNRAAHPVGFVLITLGIVALLWCVRDFYVSGKGTLAPWAPPQRLVIIGLYRYSRNPMYVSVLLVLLGWAFTFGSVGLFVYTIAVLIAFHLRVVFGEEPWLARRYGSEWESYVSRVPRWLWRAPYNTNRNLK
jgi:protein-S-isoprenylcysteine O-methyltransferase Ste14